MRPRSLHPAKSLSDRISYDYVLISSHHGNSRQGRRMAPLALKNQFGTQAAALISPNSRAILRQDAPASSVT